MSLDNRTSRPACCTMSKWSTSSESIIATNKALEGWTKMVSCWPENVNSHNPHNHCWNMIKKHAHKPSHISQFDNTIPQVQRDILRVHRGSQTKWHIGSATPPTQNNKQRISKQQQPCEETHVWPDSWKSCRNKTKYETRITIIKHLTIFAWHQNARFENRTKAIWFHVLLPPRIASATMSHHHQRRHP